MENLVKNKSILIDGDHHQKAKKLADNFNVPLKKYVEDMIKYCHKNGINPSVILRDQVAEKLNNLEKLLFKSLENDQEVKRQLNSFISQQNETNQSVKRDTAQIKGGMDSALAQRVEHLRTRNKEYFDFIKKLYEDQLALYNFMRKEHPNFLQGKTGVIPNSYVAPLSDFLNSFKKSIEITKKLFPKNK
ncbi:hypothetical protein KIH41_17220 [Litoribacter ruber]|uniref:hypothetical protein n=1 Tax=Litoribacter ruber TaxID=702568 RepID=UPI001BDB0C67|nr:hypothetical protein [Litoribacter ruber]MBT0813032.1 hypothetical protein [Litoribacter ruber]